MKDRMKARVKASMVRTEELKRERPSPAVILACELSDKYNPAPPQFIELSQPKEKEESIMTNTTKEMQGAAMLADIADAVEAYTVHGDTNLKLWIASARRCAATITGDKDEEILQIKNEAQAQLEWSQRTDVEFDGYEIRQVVEFVDGIGCTYCEPLSGVGIEIARKHASYVKDFWTLYGHLPTGGVMAIADYDSEATCEEMLKLIGGKRTA